MGAKRGVAQYDVEVGKRARYVREVLGLTTTYVGEMLGFTRQTLTNYERGETRIPASVLFGMGRLYGVDADWLVGIVDTLVMEVTKPDGRVMQLKEYFPHVTHPDGMDGRI